MMNIKSEVCLAEFNWDESWDFKLLKNYLGGKEFIFIKMGEQVDFELLYLSSSHSYIHGPAGDFSQITFLLICKIRLGLGSL